MIFLQTKYLSAAFLGLALAVQSDVPPDRWKAYTDAASSSPSPVEAEKLLLEALREAGSFGAQDRRLGITLNALAGNYQSRGRDIEAEEYFKRAILASKEAGSAGASLLATVHNNLGTFYSLQGKDIEAELNINRSIDIAKRIRGAENPELVFALQNLTEHYISRKRYAEAEPLLLEMLDLSNKMGERTDLQDCWISYRLAGIYRAQGRYADAEQVLLDVIDQEQAAGRSGARLGLSVMKLANSFREDQQMEHAELLYQRALSVFEKTEDPLGRWYVMHCLNELAQLYQDWHQFDKAEDTYRRELDLEMKAIGPNSPYPPWGITGLGNLLREQGRLEEIEPLVRAAIDAQERAVGPGHLGVVQSLISFAHYLTELKKFAAAEPRYRRALKIQEELLGADHPDVASTLEAYAGLLRETDRPVEAAAIAARVEKIRAQQGQRKSE